MREMKDVPIDWAPKIPVHWECMPNKYLMRKIKKICAVHGDEDIISLSMNGVIVRDLEAGGKMPTTFNGYQFVYPGNLLMCLFDYDVTPRCIGYINNFGITSPAYSQFEMKSGNIAKYYYYYYLMIDNTKELLHLAKNLRHSFTEDELGVINTVVPPTNEQQQIADYLDRECGKIDGIISEIQGQIDTLELHRQSCVTEAVTVGLNKNAKVCKSRIFYMAPYNIDWKLSKIGYECEKLWKPFNANDTALICSNKGKVFIRPEDMTGKMVSEDNAMQGISRGDIAIHGMDTWHGAIALSDYDGKITRVVHVCDSKQDKRFIVYYLQHLAYQGVYKLISNGIRGNTSDFRSWEKVKDIYIAFPDVAEQCEICDYLDNLCVKTDEIIATKQEQIAVLENYKKSLIYEYVTGKKEVV